MKTKVTPFTFRSIGKFHCDWHFELNDKGKYWDWLWLDGWTEQGYWYGLTLAWRMEMMEHRVGYEKKDWPLIDLLITNPEGKTHRAVRSFPREQFKVEKRKEQGGWAIVNLPWATHPTFLNGAPIDTAGVILKEGDRLSINGMFFQMTVRILMS